MRDTIELAREAGMKASRGKTDKDGNYHPFINALGKDVPIEWIEAFEALVRADEQNKQCEAFQQILSSVKAIAIADEREACAKVCETLVMGKHCAAAIRARGNV
jgi:hypothetical protein